MSEVLRNPARRHCVTARVLLLAVAAAFSGRATAAQTKLVAPAGPVTLREVFDSVRNASPLLGAAGARVRAAEGAVTSARTWTNPVLNFESEKMTEQGSQRETMTTAMLPLEPLYQRGPIIQRAEALRRASQADAFTQRQQLALGAADAFYKAALAQVNVAATQSLAQWFDTVVAYNSVRVREGVTAEADLIRSELERDLVLNELAMADSELARAQADLQVFFGVPSTSPIWVEVDSLPVRTGTVTIVTRPEVEAARERLIASEAGTASEKRMLLRDLGAMVGTKNASGSSSLVAGFTLPIPLLDQNRGNIRAARAESDAARFELEQERRFANAEVIGAERAAGILLRRVSAFGRGPGGYLARAEDSRRIALGAYREGGTGLLQVIDAARAWREARSSYFETLFAQHQSVIRRLVAQGIDVLDTWPAARAGAAQ